MAEPAGSRLGPAGSEGALLALVPSLALELAPRRINAVSPGAIATPIWSKLGTPIEAANTAMAAEIALGRLGTSDDSAEMVAFLASPAAANLTSENTPNT